MTRSGKRNIAHFSHEGLIRPGWISILLFLVILNLSTKVNAQIVIWSEGFEEAGNDTYTSNQAAIPGLSNQWEYIKTDNGRLRMAAGAGYYRSGSRAATFDANPTGTYSENYLIATIDVSAYSSFSDFDLSFSYMDHNDEDHATDRIWARAEPTDAWIEIYDLQPDVTGDGNWNDISGVDVSGQLTGAGQTISNTIYVRFGQEDQWESTSVTGSDGITFDDIQLFIRPPNYGNSPGLVFWLRGDAGVSGTDPITGWADQSGNGNNANPNPTGPVFSNSTLLNFQPVLTFDGTRELNIADDARINTGGGYDGDERSMFIAFSTGADVTSATPQYLFEEGGGTNGLGVYIKNDNIYVNIYNNSGNDRITSYSPVSANRAYVVSFIWDNGTLTAKLNNTAFTTQTTNGTITTLLNHGGDISIGFTDGTTRNETGGNHSNPSSYNGEIAEILYYDEALSTVDESFLNNILGIKYGLVQTQDADYYYSYQSGNWDDVSTWTHDPGGTTQTATDIPNGGDVVVILDSRTVTLDGDVDTTGLDVTIRSGGILDQSTFAFSAGLFALSGSGTHKLASVNYPSVTSNDFVSTDGGTTEYDNASSFTLPLAQDTYYHLRINAPGVTATQLSNITLNGDLHIRQGTYQINDASANRCQLSISGNVMVENGASFTIGTGNTDAGDISGGTAPFIDYYDRNSHRIVVRGDFTNEGTVRFTNQSFPVFNAFPANGMATVYFMGATNNTLTCNGTTDFYNLVLDKGIDQTYKLTVYSSAYENFRLFGRNSEGGENGGPNPDLRKALWIRTGTLELSGLTVIPTLSEGGGGGSPNSDFYIPANGALVLNGSEVVVLATADDYQEVRAAYNIALGGSGEVNGVNKAVFTSSFSIYGKFQIDDGYFSTRESGGLITWDVASGQVEINGGIVDAKQIRSAGSGGGLASYTQSGGVFVLRGRFQRTPSSYSSVSDLVNAPINTTRATGGLNGSFGTFNLNETANVFIMSGGTIQVYDACGGAGWVFDVYSSDKNINVSGGTVEFIPTTGTGTDATTHFIRSNAPFYNLTVNRASSTTAVELDTYPLVVLNDLNLTSGVLRSADFDVTIGGDYHIQNGTTYTPGSNTTIFNGTDDQVLTLNNAGTTAFKKLKIDKSVGTKLTLAGTGTTLSVEDSLLIYNAELADGGKTIQLTTSATTTTSVIYNSGLHSGAGEIEIADNDPTLITGDGTGIFENINLNNTDVSGAPVSLGANTIINGELTFSQSNKLFNISTYNLFLNPSATITGASTTEYIQTAGNVGDGGLTREYASTATLDFPVGVSAYTPASIGFSSAPSTYGTVTITPVDYEHTATSTDNEALSYFWRVKSSGITGYAGNVVHSFTYSDGDITGVESNYVPAVYYNTVFTWSYGTTSDVSEATNTFTDWTNPTVSADFLDGDYTAGEISAFNDPAQFFSRQSGLWNVTATWTNDTITGNPASRIPTDGDVVVIRNSHTVSFLSWNTTPDRDPHNAASLLIQSAGILDIGYNPGSNFGIVGSLPNGNGLIRISCNRNSGSTFQFPGGDFSDFNSNLGTTELYTTNPTSGTTYWLPNGITEYGNLIISPLGGSNIIFPNNDLLIYGNLITRGQNSQSWFLPTWNSNYPTPPIARIAKTITINGNFQIEGGAFIWYGNNALAQDFVIFGDLVVSSNAGLQDYSNASNQSISIGGNFINNSLAPGVGANAYRGCDFDDIPLIFFGSGTHYITNDDPSDNTYTNIETLTVNKGTSQADSLIINITGTFSTPNNDWLYLQNGTFKYEHDANLNITTSSVFNIPSTAGLHIDAPGRTIRLANANSDDNDVFLNGKLTIVRGDVEIGNNGNNRNNDIEYSGGGDSKIDIQGGSLFVNGQIRRNPASTSGVLKYNQSGGDVTVNGRNTLTSNAKLEILNTGSEFNMSGGTLTIVRGGGGGTYGDLYLRPANSTVSGGEIIFNPSGAGDQDYLLDATVPVFDLTINGSGGDDANVELLVSPLEVNGDLTLQTATSFLDASEDFNIDVTLNGDFTNNGSYRHRENHTYFTGGAQSLLGSSNTSFYDITVNPVTSLTLSRDITISHDTYLSSGTLICGNNTATATGDVTNNATYTDNASGIILYGTTMQYIGGTGTWGQLELDNPNGARLTSSISLQSDFLLTNGILDINDYMLTLGANSDIVGSGYSSAKMITSDGAASNMGVKKIFSNTADGTTFTLPMGTSRKYTPAVLTITDIGTTGSFRINNINSNHPGVLDPNNVLDYYWEVETSGIAGFNGSLVLNYQDADVQVTGSNTEAEYIAAALLLPGTSWTKAATGPATDRVDEGNDLITFNYTGVSSLSGEYTCGIDAALPDNVPEFTSNTDGDWSEPGNWTQTGGDPYILTGGPNGFIVTIRSGDDITTDANYASAYRTTINGRLIVPSSSFGHNLGIVSGTGTLALQSGTFPAGRYDDFLDCSNGATLEYGGSGTYTIIADLYSSVPNIHFTGTGSRVLPNKDLTICNQLLINGPDVDNSINNRHLFIQGSMERYSGTFLSGSGADATVSFAGSSAQTIGGVLGDFIGASAFNNLEIDNSAGLTINSGGEIEVRRNLLLTDGNISSSAASTISISNTAINCVVPAGGSSMSFVDGPLSKRINQGDHFDFPVGKGSTPGNKIKLSATQTGTQYWSVEYFTPNGTSASMASPLTYVNDDEYWTVASSSGNKAIINLDWDASSDLTPLMTENGLSDMRVAAYNTGSSEWEGLSSSASGSSSSGTVSTTSRITIPAAGSTDYTVACVNVVKPRAQFTPSGAICGTATGIPVNFTYSGAIPFDYTVDYTIDGVPQTQLDITSGDVVGGIYTMITPAVGVYELTAFRYNGGTDQGVVDPTSVEVYELPTTADIGSDGGADDDDISDCGASSVTNLPGNNPIVGTGLWSIISGAGGSFVEPTVYNTRFNGTNGTSYQLKWEITNGACTSSDTLVVTFPLLAQQPAAFTVSTTPVCQGTSGVVYRVPNDPSVTYNWSYSGTGATINGSGNSVTVDFDATATSGDLSVTATNGCGTSAARTMAIIVTPTMTAGLASSEPTVCVNTPLPSITHTTTGATGIGAATDLPAGVSAAWAADLITISGTPTEVGTFDYSIPLNGGCGTVNATGRIIVEPDMIAGAPSSTETLCVNTVLTNIIHATTWATGISNDGVSGANGLPAGVSATWAGDVITISGTPSAAGIYNYSIPLTGGCGIVNATGTITVDALPTVTLSESGSPIAENGGISTITATLSAFVSCDVTVDLAYSGTATGGGVDYTASGIQIIIGAGSLNGSVDITGVDDALIEGEETVLVSIASVTNGTDASAQQMIRIRDNDVPPVIVTCAGDKIINADASCQATIPDLTGEVVATDDGVIVSITQSPAADDIVSTGVHEVTITVTDDDGNEATCIANVDVIDVTNPTASNPPPIGVQCIGDVPAPDITVVTDEADNCTAAPIVAFINDVSDGNTCPEVITRTYSVTDGFGNSIIVTQNITVDDITAPTFTAPADITIYSDASCAYDASISATGDVTDEADNCGVGEATYSDVVDNTDPCSIIITRTWSLTDNCANAAADQVQTITVEDNIPPTASNPAPINVECSGDVPAPDVIVVTDEADNCTAAPVVAFVSDVSDGNTCPEVITRTYSVTDDCGNSINVTQTITVDDNTPPTASNPAPINVECAGDVPLPDITVVTDEADNCTAAPVVAFVSDVSDGNTCPEVITRTYSVTDDCGNSINVTQTITIEDVTPPTAICRNITIQLDALGNVTITAADIDNGSSDNCAIETMWLDRYDFDCTDLGPNTVNLTVRDACGLESTCSATVTVQDNLGPDLTCPADFNEFVDINDDFIIPDYTGLVFVSDNCNPSPTLTQNPVDGTVINGVGTIQTITITADDGNGNNSQCTFDITLIDSLTLSILCPPDQNEFVDGSCEFLIPDYTTLATTTGAVSVSQDPVAGTVVSGHGTVQAITLTATDGGGNTEQCSFNVTLQDNTSPVISGCPADINTVADTSYCGVEVTWTEPTISDNCSGVILASSHNPGDFFPVGTTTVTYTATDDSGLTDICSFDVFVADAPLPVISGPTAVCTPGQETYSVVDPGTHTFIWTVTNGIISGSATDPVVTVDWSGTAQGTVEVTITSASGCTSTNSITVDKYETPTISIINSSNSLTRR